MELVRRGIKFSIVLIGVLLVLAALAWLVWVPGFQEPPYRLDYAWGGKGSAPGLFHDPTGIAVTTDEVFVSDSRNHRIQVFDKQGRFLREFGSEVLGRPMNLEIQGGRLYVADYWNDNISIFSLAGELLAVTGESGSGPGKFKAPGGVAVGPDGSIFVADFYNQRIQQLNPDGSFVLQWGRTGKTGIRGGQFNYPTDVAIDRDGRVYVADGYNDRVQVIATSQTDDRAVLNKWGGPFAMNIFGPFHGWFATVTSVAIGPDGSVFAADFYNDRVQKFTHQGDFLTAFGTPSQGPSHSIIAVAVDEEGSVFAANYDAHRIEKWIPLKPSN
ncbi:MAG: 6-bladed beta-propeller [Gammaproteobacteria bacterium]|nr:6-bladed beta-propeller [Gammaproteobacteria bacterium]